MQTENRFFDDIARLASGTLGAFAGVRDEIQAQVRQQFERVLAQMDVVSRDEFEAVKAMAAKARSAQEALETRVAALEARLAELTRPAAPAAEAATAKTGAAKPARSRSGSRRASGEPS